MPYPSRKRKDPTSDDCSISDEERVKAFLRTMVVGSDLKAITAELYQRHGLTGPKFVRHDGVPFFFTKIMKQVQKGDKATIELCASMNVRFEMGGKRVSATKA
jgi:hypothetical protein